MTPPVARNPTVVDEGANRGSEKAREGVVDAVVGDITACVLVIPIRKVRNDRFVGNGGIIKGERSREEAVARNSMGVSELRQRR
jgi:hypothetical protein